jgi:hypothetical protein
MSALVKPWLREEKVALHPESSGFPENDQKIKGENWI